MPKVRAPKKLIEVALPLDDINAEAAREKSIRHGHPSTLHLWWARRPLAAARAVLFAQLVNDPGGERGYKPGMTKEQAQRERERLFDIMRRLVKWENSNNEEVLREAREEILKSWRETCEMNKGLPGFDPDKLPAFHDPFAGGGSIPLEAQRLGLQAYASDLNPVAVLINKALIEIPPKFAGRPPVNPEARSKMGLLEEECKGARGLAEDIRYYGKWMRDEAFKRIGHLYPQVELPPEHGGGKATVIAWLWARTVKSPNPAYSHVDVPLISSFWLSKKKGKEVFIQPVVNGDRYSFTVVSGLATGNLKEIDAGTTWVAENGRKIKATFKCIVSGSPIKADYIDEQANCGKMGFRLMAVVVQGRHGRIYLAPDVIDVDSLQREIHTYFCRDPHFAPVFGLVFIFDRNFDSTRGIG
ncbi:DUF1156 domain-containing protein [Alicyclobacillus acidocaldarius]|uniref:DUF1156 domain-containing protein n=1 Tax=Alicyclobacillus acidocaldarius (strain Tc-4-1) TaxID=1048834 RepID=F8IGT3_ALIAT|nr:DUF1156 domain-containing protein [Alicyclobacillus acidocaldarius]AEJ43098.1 protein of unknown function DUF1156 [Alicyclobacillus acidocaldarius subsp. acidocaldarius Tc-4-1]